MAQPNRTVRVVVALPLAKGSAMSNLVLFGELRQRLDEHLEWVSRVATEGDAGSALFVMRQDVPGLVAALRVFADEHRPDENGSCRKCRRGPFWRRVAAPCRMLLDAHLAAETATAATKARGRHRSPSSSVD